MRDLLTGGLPGRFFRGNLHCHSDRSDGALPPAEVVRAYREAGYDFVAITDHFEERFGWPVTDTRSAAHRRLHDARGRRAQLGRLVGAGRLLGRRARAAAGLRAAGRRPPRRGDLRAPPPAARSCACCIRGSTTCGPRSRPAFPGLDAVEVYTHQSWIYRPDTAIAAPFLDALLDDGRRLGAVAADDAHFRDGPDAFGAWVEVFARELDAGGAARRAQGGHLLRHAGPARSPR